MKNIVLACAFAASSVFAGPQLILDSYQLDYVKFTEDKTQKLNSGWEQDGTAFVRPFNKVFAGTVRYGAVFKLPAGTTAELKFLSAQGAVLKTEKIRGGSPCKISGTFDQPGTLASVRLEPSRAVPTEGLFVVPFRITVGWAADELFSYAETNALPVGWTGKGAKVIDLPYLGFARKNGKAGYDRPLTDAVLEIAPGGCVNPKIDSAPLTNAYIFEFDALVASETDFRVAGVRLRDHYAFTPNVWYHFRFEVADGRARIKLNGREIAKDVKIDGFKFENLAKATSLLIDDVKAYAQEFPSDYPPAPIRPKGEEKWDVLLNVCPLWYNGNHAGWRCIEQGHGPKLVLGYYDEGLPETADWEIKYMVEHGIDVQLFCWYPEGHDGPIRHPYHEFHLRDGFKNARYSHEMKYALIWEIQNAGRPHSLEAWKKNYVPYLIEHHFKDPRYYFVDGKAYLEVFGSWNFKDPTSFGSAEATKEAFAYLDGELKRIGFKGLYAVWCHGPQNSPEIAAHGFDAVAPYGYGTDGYKIEKQKAENLNRAKCPNAFPIPAVSVGFNSEPWHGKRYPMLTPADFNTSLRWVRDEFIPSQPHKTDWEKRVIVLSDWNEYGEGTYLMPTEDERGFGYLDAIRAVFTDEKPNPSLNLRPTVAQRQRICHLYPQSFSDAASSLSDDAKHDSTAMNAASYAVEQRAAGGLKVLFIGNSITLHAPLAAIGWTNNWGMAASAPEKDFVHLVTRELERRFARKADLLVRNYADFERGFRNWDWKKTEELAKFNPDVLVFALGENVQPLEKEADRLAYRDAFKRLIGTFLDGKPTKPLVVVRGTFWSNPNKDWAMANAASDYAIPFVKADFYGKPGMDAVDSGYAHKGIQAHPGDRGMAAIAARILEGLLPKKN